MYRSQLQQAHAHSGRIRTYHGHKGSVALDRTDAWEVTTYHGDEPDKYSTDNAEAAILYYCEQVVRVK